MRKGIAIDIGEKCGVCVFETSGPNHAKVLEYGVARKMGGKGRYIMIDETLDNMWKAWDGLIARVKPDLVIAEEGFGNRVKVVNAQARMRGFIWAAAMSHDTKFMTINVAEWRRAVKDAFGVTFPANTDRVKALSLQLVRDNFGIDNVEDHVSDAVLIAQAATRLGYIS